MSEKLNVESDLSFDVGGYELGKKSFQSMLLAGERYVVSNMKRKGTDEEKFAKLFHDLQTPHQDLLHSYFVKQSKLDISQRAKLLGDLVDIEITDPLTMQMLGTKLMKRPSLASSLSLASDGIKAHAKVISQSAKSTKSSSSHNRLSLRLDKITVEEAQDDYYIWTPWKRYVYNTTDEVTLGVVTIDESGWVKNHSHNMGSIKEGRSKSFDDFRLCTFNLGEGGSTFPKAYSATVYAIERDSGGYNDFIQKAAAYAREKITEELIAQGIIQAGQWFGVTIPPDIANFIANVLKGFIDSLIDWLAGLFTNNDDVLGQRSRSARINSYNGHWSSTGGDESAPWTWRFAGAGGRWSTNMHWYLEQSNTPES